ncbi:MAG: UbiA family prenyltransferase [Scytonema sp. PMC 1069.18]|nr:UbiA family prenyltransferase [Scytonema sp. PMC 1069.18]
MPSFLFSTAAWKNSALPFSELLLVLGRSGLYFLLSILSFCIANQIAGIEEDRINKPSRPLVSGAVSLRGAFIRWVFNMVAFSLVGWSFGILKWALLWQVFIILNNFAGWDKHWFTKNLVVGIAALIQAAAAWQIVTPITPVVWNWVLMVGGAWTTLVAVQDFRDLEGDRAIGRKTFPMVFGATASRVTHSVGFVLLPFVTHIVLMRPAGNTLNVWLCDVALALLSWIIAARVIFYRNPQADHQTYILFTFWFCLVLGSAIVVL